MDPPPRPVHFAVDELPFDAHQSITIGRQQSFSYNLENIAAAYQPVVEAIVGSPINKAGRIASVYVNLRSNRRYEIVAPRADFFKNLTQRGFQRMLPTLFSSGSFRDPDTDQLIWQAVPDMSHVMASSFPSENTHFVGCLSGDVAHEEATLYRDFISTALNNHTYIFVAGCFARGLMHEFITEEIKVSSFSLTTEVCLIQICNELEDKWGIN